MSAQPNLLHVPLSKLQMSIHNARKTGAVDITGLAASIEAHGLMQNLSVLPSTNDAEAFEVIAGGRRLAALQLLQKEGRLASNYLVPIRVIADDAALEASTAENVMREPMHPADQFDAFRGMVEAKKSIADIAAHFGVSEVVVRQRLKLANVAPKLVQIYRDGGMDMEQLQTLALTDDHKAQEKAWFSPKHDWERSAGHLRRTLTESKVRADSAAARFVGIDAYERAGGQVVRDLFSSRDEAFLSDRTLLDTLAMDQLEAVAQQARDEGWSWAVARISADYDQLAEYPHTGVEPKTRKPTQGESARIGQINERLAEVDRILQDDADANYDESNPHCLDDDRREAFEEEQEQLQQERANLSARTEVWPDDVKAKAGVVVFLDHGGLRVVRGRLQPGQKVDKAGIVSGSAKAPAGKDKPKKATLSADMILRLEMHRAAAIRVHVANNPKKALSLLLTDLVLRLISTSGSGPQLDVNASNAHGAAEGLIRSKFGDLAHAPARKALNDRIAEWKKAGLPTKAVELFTWVEKLPEPKRLELLALCTALTVETNSREAGVALAQVFEVDMTAWWTPSPLNYLEVVPKALLAEAVGEVAGKAAGDAVVPLKKDAAIAEAAKRLAGTGWLPKPLRGVAYRLGKPAAAKAKATTPAPTPAKRVADAATRSSKALRPGGNRKKPAKKAAKPTPKKADKK